MPKKRIKYKLWFRCVIAFIVSLSFTFSVFLIKRGFEYKEEDNSNYLYTYNINQNISYKVFLYDNSFIDEEYLNEGNMYVSQLVKDIQIVFLYDYTGNEAINLEYTYSIKGKLLGEYASNDSSNNIWSKEYVLLEETTKRINNTLKINIKEDLNLDFPKFNDEVKSFKSKFSIFINSKIDVIMDISIKGVIENEKINDQKQMKISIPLGKEAFSIDKDYKENDVININRLTNNEILNKYFILGILLLAIVIFLFIITFKIIFNVTKKSNYDKKLNRILRNYGEVIVEITSPIDSKEYSIIEVRNIEEMIDLEQELKIPITFFEIKKGKIGEFVIIYNEILYKYTLKDDII